MNRHSSNQNSLPHPGRQQLTRLQGALAGKALSVSLSVMMVLVSFFACTILAAQEVGEVRELAGFPPAEVRVWFRNPDGSCVQCANGISGLYHNCPQDTTLLWDTRYGKAVRGGSWPSRVEDYCEKRGIPAWNITGETTFDWLRWCGRNGRMAAIGAGTAHFQAFVWHDPEKDLWYVNNNNSPEIIDVYTWKQFQRLHLASGAWIVVLNLPPPPAPPKYVEWWAVNPSPLN